MIDLTTETLLTFQEALKHPFARRHDGKPATNTIRIHKWCTQGVRGVHLESVLAGGIRCTSKEALERFFAAINERDANQKYVLPMPRTPAKRQKESEKAGELCAAAGF